MSDYDLVLRNGTLISGDDVHRGDIAVVDGKTVKLAPSIDGTGTEEIDATGLHVFPGGIDPHVHFNEPGRTSWEGFATGTQALAAGGMTLYFDMPLNCQPTTVNAESFDKKLAAAQASSLVDFAFWGGLVPGNIDRLEEL